MLYEISKRMRPQESVMAPRVAYAASEALSLVGCSSIHAIVFPVHPPHYLKEQVIRWKPTHGPTYSLLAVVRAGAPLRWRRQAWPTCRHDRGYGLDRRPAHQPGSTTG